jgi:hypothetical protein
MRSRYWLVDDTSIELIDRGRAGVTLVASGTRQSIPPMTIGSWPVAVAGRTVVLEAKRNLDVICYQLICDRHLVPRRSHAVKRDVPPFGAACSAHEAAAVTRCPRCTRPYCSVCAPDGNHCSSCLRALVAKERAAIKTVRRIGVAASFGLTLVTIAAGVAIGSPRVTHIGFVGTAFMMILSVRMLIRERAESRAGVPPASDT